MSRSTTLKIFVKHIIEKKINKISLDYSKVRFPYLFYIGMTRLNIIIIKFITN